MTGSGGYLGKSGVMTIGGPGGGGGGGWVGPYHLAYTDFVAGPSGYYYANVATLTAGWLISDVLGVNVTSGFSATGSAVYWGADITAISHAAAQAWLSYSAGIDLRTVDENAILSGFRDQGYVGAGFRSLRAACDAVATGTNVYDFFPALVSGSGHVLQAWVSGALTSGACDIYLLVSTPTAP